MPVYNQKQAEKQQKFIDIDKKLTNKVSNFVEKYVLILLGIYSIIIA